MNLQGTALGQRRLQLCTRPFSARQPRAVTCLTRAVQRPAAAADQAQRQQQDLQRPAGQLGAGISASMALWLLSDLPALAAGELGGGPPASSYYVSLGLFLITLPGAAGGDWQGRVSALLQPQYRRCPPYCPSRRSAAAGSCPLLATRYNRHMQRARDLTKD
jgi:hypothetical protein